MILYLYSGIIKIVIFAWFTLHQCFDSMMFTLVPLLRSLQKGIVIISTYKAIEHRLRGCRLEPTQGHVSSLVWPHCPLHLFCPIYPKWSAQMNPKTIFFSFDCGVLQSQYCFGITWIIHNHKVTTGIDNGWSGMTLLSSVAWSQGANVMICTSSQHCSSRPPIYLNNQCPEHKWIWFRRSTFSVRLCTRGYTKSLDEAEMVPFPMAFHSDTMRIDRWK